MPEHIEREAFKNKYLCCGHLQEISEEDFDAFPAADVEPVRHGRWVPKEKMIKCPGARNYICSRCGHEPLEIGDYCPNCGAKMDLKS